MPARSAVSPGLGLLAAAAVTGAVAAGEATVTLGSVGAAPGTTVRVPVRLTTDDLVGAFDFVVDAAGWTVDDVDYNGLLFSNGWTGWDTAPAVAPSVTAACIFPQDQVTGVDLHLLDLLVAVPEEATPGGSVPVTFTSITVSDYSFIPYDVTAVAGAIVITTAGCDEDVTGNGSVGFDDLLAVMSAWGVCDCPADVDGDGIVGLGDLLRVLASWGGC